MGKILIPKSTTFDTTAYTNFRNGGFSQFPESISSWDEFLRYAENMFEANLKVTILDVPPENVGKKYTTEIGDRLYGFIMGRGESNNKLDIQSEDYWVGAHIMDKSVAAPKGEGGKYYRLATRRFFGSSDKYNSRYSIAPSLPMYAGIFNRMDIYFVSQTGTSVDKFPCGYSLGGISFHYDDIRREYAGRDRYGNHLIKMTFLYFNSRWWNVFHHRSYGDPDYEYYDIARIDLWRA